MWIKRIVGWASAVFVGGIVTVNLPGAATWFNAQPWDKQVAGGAIAGVVVAAAVVAMGGAFLHWRVNRTLIGVQRWSWYAIICLPGFGAVAYYLAQMRGEPGVRAV